MKPIVFDNVSSNIMLAKFQKMTNMRIGSKNTYFMIEKNEFLLDVKEHRKNTETKKMLEKFENQKLLAQRAVRQRKDTGDFSQTLNNQRSNDFTEFDENHKAVIKHKINMFSDTKGTMFDSMR